MEPEILEPLVLDDGALVQQSLLGGVLNILGIAASKAAFAVVKVKLQAPAAATIGDGGSLYKADQSRVARGLQR